MITASVVLYNTEIDFVQRLIDSFKPSDTRKLYLIDNSPEKLADDTINLFSKDITYIYNHKNIGYGAAHNIGIEKSIKDAADYHIVLNPDVFFTLDTIIKLIEYAEHFKDAVYILPKVTYPDGSLQYLCKLLPTPFDLIFRRFLPQTKFTEKMNDKYILKSTGYNKLINPPCLSGCFMFMRVSALKKYNLYFDDRFFMYCEDFDLIRRMHRIGKTIYYPEVSIIHNHAKESYKSKKMLIEHIKSAVKYFNKYGWIIDKERKQMNNKILTDIEKIND